MFIYQVVSCSILTNFPIYLTLLSVCKALLLTFRGMSGESITPLNGNRYLGTTSLIANNIGSNDLKKASKVFAQSLTLSISKMVKLVHFHYLSTLVNLKIQQLILTNQAKQLMLKVQESITFKLKCK